jgi:hypothetical protein
MPLRHVYSIYGSVSSFCCSTEFGVRIQGQEVYHPEEQRLFYVLSLCLLIYFDLLAIRTMKPIADPKQRIRVNICDGNRRGCFGRSRIGIDVLKLPAFSP